jgi:hypothetical protein
MVGNQALGQWVQKQTRPQRSGANLSRFTQFRFQTGPVVYTVNLPQAATVTLPVELRHARHISFQLVANASGNFSFNLTLDGLPHLQVTAFAGYDVGSGMAATGLRLTATRQVRRVMDPISARERIEQAGQRLQAAINQHNAAATAETTGGPAAQSQPQSDLERAKAVVSAIGEMYGTVKEVNSRGRAVPQWSLELGGRWSTRGSGLDPAERERQATVVGGMFTLYF